MRKTALIAAVVLIMVLCSFLGTGSNAFAECLLDAEFVSPGGESEPEIALTSNGKTATGYLKVVNIDSIKCMVNVDLRIYSSSDDTKKIASKSISFGYVSAGTEVIKEFALSSKRELWGRSLTAVINPTVIQDDGDAFDEDDGSISIELPAKSVPDLTVEWGTLTLSANSKRVNGELIVSNIGEQDCGKFTVSISIGDDDRVRKKINVYSLKAGNSRTLNFSYASAKPMEWVTLLASADRANNIYESDDNNNTAISPVLWNPTSCSERIVIKGLERYLDSSTGLKVKVGRLMYGGAMKLINCGDTDLVITDIFTDKENLVASRGGDQTVIAPKKFMLFSLDFMPIQKGLQTATLTIMSDDPQEPVKTFTVVGVGL